MGEWIGWRQCDLSSRVSILERVVPAKNRLTCKFLHGDIFACSFVPEELKGGGFWSISIRC